MTAQLKGFAEIAGEYSATKWNEWQGNSRSSFCDGNSVVIFELIRPKHKATLDRLHTLKIIRDYLLNQNSSKPTGKDKEVLDYVLENSYRLKEITPEIVTKTLQLIALKLDGSPASSDTYRKRKQTFGAVMDYAFRNNYVKDNSFKRVKVKKSTIVSPLDPVKALRLS